MFSNRGVLFRNHLPYRIRLAMTRPRRTRTLQLEKQQTLEEEFQKHESPNYELFNSASPIVHIVHMLSIRSRQRSSQPSGSHSVAIPATPEMHPSASSLHHHFRRPEPSTRCRQKQT